MSRTYKIDHIFKGDDFIPTRWHYRSKYGDNGLGKFFKKHYSGIIRSAEKNILNELEKNPDLYEEVVFKNLKKRIMWDVY